MAVMRNQTALLPTLLPPLVADVAGLMAMFALFPPLAERLDEPGGLNALLLSCLLYTSTRIKKPNVNQAKRVKWR